MRPITNRQLFAEAYLRDLRDLRGRRPADEAIVDSRRQTIKEWRDEYHDLNQRDKMLAYLRQCLSTLGLSYQTCAEPDHFVLFADSTFAKPLGILLPVTDDQIGRTTKGRHHQWRLVRLLREHSLTWGVVTNGRDWRLCNAGLSAPYETWLEASLDDLLSADQAVEFALFESFFGRAAFSPIGDDESRQGLDAHLAESEKSTQAIENHLKGRVERILQNLCLGFVQDESRSNLSQADRDWIYRNAIYLLYRILFLLYAEARQLLPTAYPPYAAIGLEVLLEAARLRQRDGQQDPDEHSLWKRLTHLCVVVDDGDEALRVRPYNGGLFSDHEHPYLRDHKISDAYLAPALFNLAFVDTKDELLRINYRDLSVRHLGTLYEGLLEYRLNLVTDEPVVVRENKGKRQFVPMSTAGDVKRTEAILEKGQAYFADDRGERKASGSYYTPEDGVQYIAVNTVLPKAHERAALAAEIVAEAESARAAAASDGERGRVERYTDQRILELVEKRLLSLRVLDPAMGSAHFLVADGQIITNVIVDTLNAGEWADDAIDTAPLLWKRRVVERCLYGVDLNPLSQELAKLALWLSSASEGKPLTFLNHHLKQGNSLYGAPLKRLSALPAKWKQADAPATADLFQDAFHTALTPILRDLARITGVDSERIEDVRAKDEAYQHAEDAAQRLRDLAHVWLGTLFGLTVNGKPVSADAYTAILQAATHDQTPDKWNEYVETQPLLKAARDLAVKHHFFHWELEFPDAVDLDSRECSFDAVTANPPYVRERANLAIATLFETGKCGDLYAWILERALGFLGNTGHLGTIVPLSLMFSRQFGALRARILQAGGQSYFAAFDASRDGIFLPNGESRNGQRACIFTQRERVGAPRVYSTKLMRWYGHDRSRLFRSLQYSDVTPFSSSDGIPKIGDNRLADLWVRIQAYDQTVASTVFQRTKTDPIPLPTTYNLYIPRTGRYYIAAMPWAEHPTRLNVHSWDSEWMRDLAVLALNSNVFYWMWCVQWGGAENADR